MTHSSLTASVRAGINIALIKYWGKRDVAANLPAVGSISLTLAELGTQTTVTWRRGALKDTFELDGESQDDARVQATLSQMRAYLGTDYYAHVESYNDVPTASGLASSASGSAALVAAAWLAGGGGEASLITDQRLLNMVRLGSGSAPRSLLGGLVELDKTDGSVRQLVAPNAWDLRMVVAVLTRAPKKTKSRPGMAHTAQTSPYYQSWIDSHPVDLATARAAISARDLPKLGAVMEHSTMKMHACMLAANPPLRYLQPLTFTVINAVESLRESGTGAWYTMDAGPHVKVLCAAADAELVAAMIQAIPGVVAVHVTSSGPGVKLVL